MLVSVFLSLPSLNKEAKRKKKASQKCTDRRKAHPKPTQKPCTDTDTLQSPVRIQLKVYTEWFAKSYLSSFMGVMFCKGEIRPSKATVLQVQCRKINR